MTGQDCFEHHVIDFASYLKLKERFDAGEKAYEEIWTMYHDVINGKELQNERIENAKLTAEISQLKSALESKHNAMLDGAEKEYLLDKKCNELRAEIERFKEIISYLPKVPTQPYEKEMAQKIERLKSKLSALRDTPGGKRLFFFMNENVRLAKELDELTRRLESPFHKTYDDVVKERDEILAECKFKLADRSDKYKIAIDAGILEWKERMTKAEAEAQAFRAALEEIERAGNDSELVCRKCGNNETLQDADFMHTVRSVLSKFKGGAE